MYIYYTIHERYINNMELVQAVQMCDEIKGFCQVKKIQKIEKNSEVGGWVKPELGLFGGGGNLVLFCMFFVFCLWWYIFPKKK